MKSRGAKIKLLGRIMRRALAIGVALPLIASPQAWAGIACLCEPQIKCEGPCCQEAHRSDTNAVMEGKNTDSETPTSCDTSMQATGGAQSSVQLPPVTVCCVLQPQGAPPTRLVPAPPQIGAAPVQFADSLIWSTSPGAAHTFNPICSCSIRPLYLAFSCLLI